MRVRQRREPKRTALHGARPTQWLTLVRRVPTSTSAAASSSGVEAGLAAKKLGISRHGMAEVSVEVIGAARG